MLGRVSRAFQDSTVNISGGRVEDLFSAYGSEVNMTDGTIERGFRADHSSVVNISGGFVDSNFIAGTNTIVNISGGLVTSGFHAEGGEVNISVGNVESSFSTDISVGPDTVVNISGGTTSFLNVASGSEVNRFLV